MAPSSSRRRLPAGLLVAIATLGPIGRKLPAPGTWGSLAGLLYFAVFFQRMTLVENLLVSAAGAGIASFVCAIAEVQLGRKDPGCVIIDEFVAMPLCFLGWSVLTARWPIWAVFLGGFALFRLYDILKPLGIRRLQVIKGGWGVVIDDLAAALAACGTLHLLVRFVAIR